MKTKNLFYVSLGFNVLFVFALVLYGRHAGDVKIPNEVRNLEKIEFLRIFFDNYFQYQSADFLTHQAAMLPLFSDVLRDEKIPEIQKMQMKLAAEDVEQNHVLWQITKTNENEYEGLHFVELKTAAAGTKKFYLKTHVSLRTVARDSENPKGLQITQLQIEPTTMEEATPLVLNLENGETHVFEFPCVVQRLDGENTELLKIQVSGFKKTLIEVSPDANWSGKSHLQAACDKKTSFKLSLNLDHKIQNIYRKVGTAFATATSDNAVVVAIGDKEPNFPRPVKAPPARPNLLKKILEQQLGFVIQPTKRPK